MDIKQIRRSRQRPQSTDRPTIITERHIRWLEYLHRLGDLPTPYLHELTSDTHRSYQATQENLRDLYHEHNIFYPSGEKIGERVISRHPQPGVLCASSIYTKNATTEKILKTLGRWHKGAPQKNPGQWQHDFLGTIVGATMLLGARRDGHTFHYHDQLVAETDGFRFPVTITWHDMAVDIELEPDPSFAFTLRSGKRITCFTEIDWDSEGSSRVSSAKRKSLWRNVLQYEQFIGREVYKGYVEKGGALVLNLFTNETRMRNIINAIETRMGGSNYMLFKYVPHFDRMNFTVPKRVLYGIYDDPFLRPGREPFSFSSLLW